MKPILLAPADGAEVTLHTPTQKQFIDDEEARINTSAELNFHWNDLCPESAEQSVPLPVSFRWEADGDGTVEVSRDPDFASVDYTATAHNAADIYNFMIGTRYYWRVRAGAETSIVRSFDTERCVPRFLYLEGNTNARDMGGWRTEDGGVLRQGLLIRCSEFDTHVVLTEKGIDTVVRELGIRTEIDQRGEAVGKITQSVLSPYGVCRHLLPMMPYTAIFEQDTKDSLVRAFAILSDPDSYPLCFHCWGGADRGGTLAFLIEAALGVSESDLHLDYELTSLSIWNIRTRNYGEYANMVERLRAFAPGQPLSAAVRAYLYSIGVKKSDVEGMRRILVGYPK